MAIINNPHNYTGGAVVFNSQPETALYANLMAKRQARQEALDQYYQNLHKSINPAGMRAEDINGGFTKKIDDAQKFYFQNRDAIRKQQTPEQRALASQYESMHQDLLMDINKSKESAAHQLEIAKANMAGKLNPTEEDLKVHHGISASIYSRGHYKDDAMTQPYTLNDLSLNVPQFDPKQQEEFYKAATQGLTAGKSYDEKNLRRDKVSGQVFIPFEQSYSDDQIKTIGDRAARLVGNPNSSSYVHYEHLMHDPNFLIPANKAYQSVYGDKDMVDTPKKAAQAATIMAAKAERNQGEELKKDETLEFQRQLQLRKYSHDLEDLSKDKDTLWIAQDVADKIGGAKKPENRLVYKDREGNFVEGYELPNTTYWNKSFSKTVGGKTVEPDAIRLTPDNKILPVFFKYVPDKDDPKKLVPEKKDGLEVIDYTLTTPHNFKDAVISLGGKAGVKQLNTEGNAIMGSKQQGGQPKKKEIKSSDISTKAAAAGYTEKEYRQLLIKNGIKIVQ